MAARVSKNAREGGRTAAKKRTCGKGHDVERVAYVPVFGRRRFYWRCECGFS